MKIHRKWPILAGALLLAVSAALWLRREPQPDFVPPQVGETNPPIAAIPTVPSPPIGPNQRDNDPVSGQTSAGAPSTEREFRDMSVRERNAIVRRIRQQDFFAIFQAWLDADRIDHDPGKRGAILTGLTGELHARTPPPEFFALLRGFIEDPANSKLERQILIGGVAGGATKQTVEFFIDLRQTAADPEVRDWAIRGMAGIGGVGDESGAQLLIPLEKLWRETSDRQVLMTIANPLAEIGAASSVQLLLDAALAPAGRDDARQAAAQNALRQIYRASATPPVAALLAASAPGSPNAKLAGDILVRIGNAAAGTALVRWLQLADDRAAPQAREWVGKTTTPVLSDIWQAATGAQFSFRSEKVRDAIRTRLAERRAAIISEKVVPGSGER